MPNLDQDYVLHHSTSQKLYQRALEIYPSGITHDTRYLSPFPIYVTHAKGSHKWDVDGHEYIDYLVGHGALILGHGYPDVVEAVQQQVAKGTHYGACHELELEWGDLVKQLMGMERVKFLSSGTEATMMAMRLCRAFTGKDKVLKFRGHFHGWHDYATIGVDPPYDLPTSLGVPEAVQGTVLAIEPNNPELLDRTLTENKDIACAIIEPNGGHWGTTPVTPDFLRQRREITQKHGVLLIFDEVITGFRHSPGGAQALYGIKPDLVTMAKILAGGLPGGGIAGRADVLDQLCFRATPQETRRQRVAHPGTYNANPLSAAAGVAALKVVATGQPHEQANKMGQRLRDGMNAVLQEADVEGRVYGELSYFHTYIGPGAQQLAGDSTSPAAHAQLVGSNQAARMSLMVKMLEKGMHFMANGGMISQAHTEADIDRTIEAFREVVQAIKAQMPVPRAV
ncbi:MAG TPA: aspartate aminotransferase family protein [Chloroflexota bacterium]|nr:aspartate aminotransferase family protein [Chloroflexota bacterium]